MRGRLVVTCLALVGFGPFTCADRDVERARSHHRDGKFDLAVEALADVERDAPEVHLARALALIAQEKPDLHEKASTSLDQAYRLIAEAGTLLAGDTAEVKSERARLAVLRGRVSFGRGLLALQKQDFAAAVGEFQRGLELDPTGPSSDDARWNLEVAYFKQHPPCRLREDDHEPDDSRNTPKAVDMEKGADGLKKRLLCAANEDWYTVEVPEGAMFYVSLSGKVEPKDDEDDTREVTLTLFGPDLSVPEAIGTAVMTDGKASVGLPLTPVSGQYVIGVTGLGRAEVAYDLGLEIVPPCPGDDEAEDNDSPDSATPLEDGQRPGLKACPGDLDHFLVKVPPKEGRIVTVQQDPSRGGPVLAQVIGLDAMPLSPEGWRPESTRQLQPVPWYKRFKL